MRSDHVRSREGSRAAPEVPGQVEEEWYVMNKLGVELLSMDEIVESLYNFTHEELVGLAHECLLIVHAHETEKENEG